jgi:hypothetical protein
VLLLCCVCVAAVEALAAVVVALVAAVVPAVVALVVVGVVVLAAGDVATVLVGVEVLDVLELGAAATMAPLALDMMSVVATDPFLPAELRKVEELGAWMLAMAFERLAPDRNPADPGAGMIIPIPAARRSIRPSSLREATLARSCSLRVCSADPFSIARPTVAPSFSTSTCMATIPASISPSTGIHARPRTSRSMSR